MEDAIIFGDFIAHLSLWFSSLTEDVRGTSSTREIDYSVFVNEILSTRLCSTCQSSPDISVASSSLATNNNWTTESWLGSDHEAIIYELNCEVGTMLPSNRTFLNFENAHWPSFKESTESAFSKCKPPQTVPQAEATYQKLSQRLLNLFTSEAVKLSKQKGELQFNKSSYHKISQVKKQINDVVNRHKCEK